MLFRNVNAILGDTETGKRADLDELQSALTQTQLFLDGVKPEPTKGAQWERLLNMFHTLDHLSRLHERCEEDEDRAITAMSTNELQEECTLLKETVNSVVADIEKNSWLQVSTQSKDYTDKIHVKVRPYRKTVMEGIASGGIRRRSRH